MHTNPEVLALLALGEREAATSEDLDHIAHCVACEREVSELGHLTQVARSISDHFTLETPSPAVWNRIRDQLGFGSEFSSDLVPPPTLANGSADPAGTARSRPLTAVPSEPSEPVGPVGPVGPAAPTGPAAPVAPAERAVVGPRRSRRAVSLALAAVLALLAGIGGTLAWQQFTSTTDTVVSSTQLQALPAWSGATGEVTLEEDAAGNKILVITMVTPRPVDGIQQVWLADATATSMTPIGPLSQPGQRFPLPKDLDVTRYPLVDISVQVPGGNPAHSGDSIVRGTLPV